MPTPPAARDSAGTLRELLTVAAPLIVSSSSLTLMHVMNRVFLTWHSPEALAASTPAGMLHWTMMSFTLGTLTYVNTFVSQYEGAKRPDRVAASVWQGIYLAVASVVLYVLVAPLAPWLFALAGHPADVQRLDVEYFTLMCYGAAPFTVSTVLSCFFSGRGANVPVMGVNFLTAAVNATLDYLLIFGAGPIPRMGIRGAAIASIVASSVSVLCFAALMARPAVRQRYAVWSHRRFDRELFGRIMRYGFPSGFQWAIDISGFTFFLLLVGRISETALAATNLAFNLNALTFIPLTGFGTAVLTLVGRRIGEGRPHLAERTTWLAAGAATAWTFAFAFVYVLFPTQLLHVYTSHADADRLASVSAEAVGLLRFVALYSMFDALAVVFGSALRGAGDSRFPFVLTAIAAWTLLVPPTWLACRYGGPHALSISWWACSAYITVVGLGMLARFRTGGWKSMRVIEAAADDRGESAPPADDSLPIGERPEPSQAACP